MVKASDILLILLTLFFPPATALILTGCSCDLLICCALTLLGYIPGHIYGFYLHYRKVQAEERYGKHGYAYAGNASWEPVMPQYTHQYQPVAAAPPAYGTL